MKLVILACLVCFSVLASAQSALSFNCLELEEVCRNMCWGAYCVPVGSDTLIWDQPSSAVRRRRRRAAACLTRGSGGSNRCSVGRGGTPGENCDEFPFQSARSTGDQENRVSRCVPRTQNSRQGGTINAFYQGECQRSAPCEFTVMFRNAGFVPGCSAAFTGGSCPASDDNQFSSGPVDTIRARGLESRATTPDMFTNGTHIPGPCRFRTNKGSVLDAPFGGYIGEKVVDYVPINQTKWDLDIENHEYLEDEDESQYDYMLDNLRSEEEWVTEQV